MGFNVNTNTLLSNVSYGYFSSEDLKKKLQEKSEFLKNKIKEREDRVTRIQTENKIDSNALASLVIQYTSKNNSNQMLTYSNTSVGSSKSNKSDSEDVVVPAGVIANIVREKELIEAEREQIKKLNIVVRTLREKEKYVCPATGKMRTRKTVHKLSDFDLEYLGF